MGENSPSQTFRDLKVWQMSRDLAIAVGDLCDSLPLCRSHALADQMQRSSISVPSNIAEGNNRGSNRDTIRFLYIARGSLAELQTQLDIAHGRMKVSQETHRRLDQACNQVGRLLGGLIRERLQRGSNKEPPLAAP